MKIAKTLFNGGLSIVFLAGAGVQAQVNPALLNSSNYTQTNTTVGCTLEDGTSTSCYEFRFYSNPEADGPFCPSTTSDVGGMAIYDAGSAPGLSVLNSMLFNLMESDGFDIVDNSGNIRINDPGSGAPPSPGQSYCLQATADNDLELVFLIPITPSDLSSPNTITTVELFGVSANGVPMNGTPPPTVGGGPGGGGSDALMPALDPCGGHHDPAGYYHWHFIANSTNSALTANGITEISCTNFTQNTSGFMGFATDGYPIYGEKESDGSTPTGLDQCNGHFGVTPEYPSGVYHYHAVEGAAPNILPCLTGKSAQNNFSYSFHAAPTGINDLEKLAVEVYPNPISEGLLTIKTEATEVVLLDELGRVVLQPSSFDQIEGGYVLDISHVANGIYILKGNANGAAGSVKVNVLK